MLENSVHSSNHVRAADRDVESGNPPWWSASARSYAELHLEHLLRPCGRWIEGVVDDLLAMTTGELYQILDESSDSLEADLAQWTQMDPAQDFTPSSDDGERATFAIDETHWVLQRNGTSGGEWDHITVSEEVAQELEEAKVWLRRLSGWRGRALLAGLGLVGNLAGEGRGSRRKVPEEIKRHVDRIRRRSDELFAIVLPWIAAHGRYLERTGSSRIQSQHAYLAQEISTWMPRVEIGEPYRRHGDYGFRVSVRFPGIGATALNVPIILEVDPDELKIVDAYPAIRGLGPDSSLLSRFREIDDPEPVYPCESCDGTGVDLYQDQIPESGFPLWMKLWYLSFSNLLSNYLGAPKSYCPTCDGKAVLSAHPQDQRLESAVDAFEHRELKLLQGLGLAGFGLFFLALGVIFAILAVWLETILLSQIACSLATAFCIYTACGCAFHIWCYDDIQWKPVDDSDP